MLVMLVMYEPALCFVFRFIKSSHCFKLFHNKRFSAPRENYSSIKLSQMLFVILMNSDSKFTLSLIRNKSEIVTRNNSEILTAFTDDWDTR